MILVTILNDCGEFFLLICDGKRWSDRIRCAEMDQKLRPSVTISMISMCENMSRIFIVHERLMLFPKGRFRLLLYSSPLSKTVFIERTSATYLKGCFVPHSPCTIPSRLLRVLSLPLMCIPHVSH